VTRVRSMCHRTAKCVNRNSNVRHLCDDGTRFQSYPPYLCGHNASDLEPCNSLRSTMRGAAYSAVLVMLAASCLDAQPGKKSQLATVTQDVDRAKIEIVYRRPVARGRELFGKLVPYGRIWTPSADSAALFTTSIDLDVNGSTLKAGRYAVWMIPDRTDWTVVFSKAQPVFHLKLPETKDEVLRITTKSHAADHMETLGVYFPMVDADSAVLNMHWGRTVVPVRIKAK